MNWEDDLSPLNANDAFNSFHKYLVETIEDVIPEKTKTISYNKRIRDPRLTSGLLKCMKKQQVLYQETLNPTSNNAVEKYKLYRSTLKKLFRYSKSQYYLNKCVEFKHNVRKVWNLINRKISKCNNRTDLIDRIRVGNVYKTDTKTMATAFCNHILTVGKSFVEKISKSNKKITDNIQNIEMNNHSLTLERL